MADCRRRTSSDNPSSALVVPNTATACCPCQCPMQYFGCGHSSIWVDAAPRAASPRNRAPPFDRQWWRSGDPDSHPTRPCGAAPPRLGRAAGAVRPPSAIAPAGLAGAPRPRFQIRSIRPAVYMVDCKMEHPERVKIGSATRAF